MLPSDLGNNSVLSMSALAIMHQPDGSVTGSAVIATNPSLSEANVSPSLMGCWVFRGPDSSPDSKMPEREFARAPQFGSCRAIRRLDSKTAQ